MREAAAMETVRQFKVALVQMAMSPDPEENLRRALGRIEQAAGAGAQVVCLPELFAFQYFCQREETGFFDLAEPIPGPTTEAVARAARKAGAAVIAPVFERRSAGVFHNSAAVIDADGRLAGVYRKMHIPDDPGYYEKFYFAPGDLGFAAFDMPFGRIGVLICWDQWYPEAARVAALRGASILFYPTAIGWHEREKDALGAQQREAWRTVQRAHAIANGVYVAAVNRVGRERPASDAGGIEFWGSSFLCDPFGVVLAEAPADREETLYGEVDPGRIEEVRRGWPFLRDRRIDAYGGLLERFLDRPDGSRRKKPSTRRRREQEQRGKKRRGKS
jgi:N-carbamoylputrescine amidase